MSPSCCLSHHQHVCHCPCPSQNQQQHPQANQEGLAVPIANLNAQLSQLANDIQRLHSAIKHSGGRDENPATKEKDSSQPGDQPIASQPGNVHGSSQNTSDVFDNTNVINRSESIASMEEFLDAPEEACLNFQAPTSQP